MRKSEISSRSAGKKSLEICRKISGKPIDNGGKMSIITLVKQLQEQRGRSRAYEVRGKHYHRRPV